MWSCDNRPNKDQLRELILPTNKPRSSIWLCGAEMSCYRKASDKGLLPPGDHMVVERNPTAAKQIAAIIPSLPIQPILFRGCLSSVDVPKPLDYANLDFLGSITLSLAKWLSQLPLSTGAGASVTVMHHYARGNRFMPICDKVLQRRHKHEDESVGMQQTLLSCLLRKYDFEGTSTPYKDSHVSMVNHLLRNFRPAKVIDDHQDIVALVEKHSQGEEMKVLDQTNDQVGVLVDAYLEADGYDAMRGWHRRLTCFCKNKGVVAGSREEGNLLRGIKSRITRRGGDTSRIRSNTKN